MSFIWRFLSPQYIQPLKPMAYATFMKLKCHKNAPTTTAITTVDIQTCTVLK